MYKNIIRILLIVGFLLFFIFKVIFPAANSFSKTKKIQLSQIPPEYINLFNKKFKNSIYHNATIITSDSSSYPVTTIKYDSKDIAIFKFKSTSKLKEILNIKYNKKERINPPYPNVPIKIKHTDFRYSTNIKKRIDFIHINTKEQIDTLSLTNSLFIGKGVLKTLSFMFSNTDKSNVIFIEKNSFFNKEYNLVVIKKNGYFYILFISPSDKILNKEDIYKILAL